MNNAGVDTYIKTNSNLSLENTINNYDLEEKEFIHNIEEEYQKLLGKVSKTNELYNKSIEITNEFLFNKSTKGLMDLFNRNIDNSEKAMVYHLKHLKKIDLSNSKIVSIKNLDILISVEEINLSKNQIYEIDCIPNKSNLKLLNLHNNNLKFIPRILVECKSIITLDLSYNTINTFDINNLPVNIENFFFYDNIFFPLNLNLEFILEYRSKIYAYLKNIHQADEIIFGYKEIMFYSQTNDHKAVLIQNKSTKKYMNEILEIYLQKRKKDISYLNESTNIKSNNEKQNSNYFTNTISLDNNDYDNISDSKVFYKKTIDELSRNFNQCKDEISDSYSFLENEIKISKNGTLKENNRLNSELDINIDNITLNTEKENSETFTKTNIENEKIINEFKKQCNERLENCNKSKNDRFKKLVERIETIKNNLEKTSNDFFSNEHVIDLQNKILKNINHEGNIIKTSEVISNIENRKKMSKDFVSKIDKNEIKREIENERIKEKNDIENYNKSKSEIINSNKINKTEDLIVNIKDHNNNTAIDKQSDINLENDNAYFKEQDLNTNFNLDKNLLIEGVNLSNKEAALKLLKTNFDNNMNEDKDKNIDFEEIKNMILLESSKTENLIDKSETNKILLNKYENYPVKNSLRMFSEKIDFDDTQTIEEKDEDEGEC